MAILNVTPDSFSDGSSHPTADSAIEAGRAMLAAGADWLDIGADSTRPGSHPTSVDVEMARLLPVIRGLAGARISVDTRNAATMTAALDAGATAINDVSALTHDPAAAGIVAARRAPVVLMHMRGTPATMHSLTQYHDVARDVLRELGARVAAAVAAGIDRRMIAVDPGIGFAKTHAQNLELLRRLPVLDALGCPILVGASRKGFIGALAGGAAPRERGPGSLAVALFAASRGAAILRVHDVAETAQALCVWRGLLGDA